MSLVSRSPVPGTGPAGARNPWRGILFATVAVVCLYSFWRLNAMTPFQHDDYAGAFVYGPDPWAKVRPTAERIDSFGEAVESLVNTYLTINGRLVPMALWELFAYTGKQGFDLLNTGMAVVLVLGLLGLCRSGLRKEGSWAIAALSEALWWLLPFPGQTVLWLSGALCYFWPATFCVLFLGALMRLLSENGAGGGRSPLRAAGAFAACAAVGLTQESIIAGVLPTALLLGWRHRSRLGGDVAVRLGGFLLGSFGLLLAPGLRQRVLVEGRMGRLAMEGLITHLLDAVAMFRSLRIVPVLFVAMLAGCALDARRTRRTIIADWPCLSAVLFSSLFAVIVGWPDERIGFGISVFGIVVALDLAWEILSPRGLFRAAVLVVGVATALDYARASTAVAQYAKTHAAMISQVQQGAEVVRVEPAPVNRFVLGAEISADPQNFHNRITALFFGKYAMSGLDPASYDRIVLQRTPCEAGVPGMVRPGVGWPLLCPVPDAQVLVGRFKREETRSGSVVGRWIRRSGSGQATERVGRLRKWFGDGAPPTTEAAHLMLLPLRIGTFLMVWPPSSELGAGSDVELELSWATPAAHSGPCPSSVRDGCG